MKRFVFIVFLGALLVIGCKKDDEEKPDPSEVSIQNVTGNYAFVGYTISQDIATYDIYALLNSCVKDNPLNLKSDKTYTWLDEGTKCTDNADQDGTWDLVGTTKFKWDTDVFDIEKFDGTSLDISISDVDSTGEPITATFKFQKK